MLVFGMGLYELFVSNLDIAKAQSKMKNQHRSNLFGLFTLREIKSVDELKTKVGHVIVMLMGYLTTVRKQPFTLLQICFVLQLLFSSALVAFACCQR
ncbi:Phosphatidylethanolamine N-methyltransferase [Bienertia sinuspersici]